MRGKRLSVIIPGYNNPDVWWRRCVNSVLANIGDNDEIILVDDCSLIKPKCIEEFIKVDSRVKAIFRGVNGGLSVARNCALDIAKGEYVTFVDSDDEVLSHTYSRAFDALKGCDADVLMFGVRSIWVNERLKEDKNLESEYIGEGHASKFKEIYDKGLLNYVWNKIFRYSFLQSNNLRFDADGMPCEDIIFVLQCIMHRAKWITINHIGINYYRTNATLLSCYKPSYAVATGRASKVWVQYKKQDDEARESFGNIGEVSQEALLRGEWDNIWRLKSPYRMKDKMRFIKNNVEIAQGFPLLFFMKKLLYQFLRNHFYFRAIRRWHIKRTFRDAVAFE